MGNPGIVGNVGNAVSANAGKESVGSKDGIIAMMDLTIESTVGRVENVRVGKGVGIVVPLGITDCDGRILIDGRVKPN